MMSTTTSPRMEAPSRASESTGRRDQMSKKATVAVILGILTVFLVEALAVLAWA